MRQMLTQHVRRYHHRAQRHDPVCDRSWPPSSSASVAQRERLMTMAGKSQMFYGKDHCSSWQHADEFSCVVEFRSTILN